MLDWRNRDGIKFYKFLKIIAYFAHEYIRKNELNKSSRAEPSWVLLDSGSTCMPPRVLTRVRAEPKGSASGQSFNYGHILEH